MGIPDKLHPALHLPLPVMHCHGVATVSRAFGCHNPGCARDPTREENMVFLSFEASLAARTADGHGHAIHLKRREPVSPILARTFPFCEAGTLGGEWLSA